MGAHETGLAKRERVLLTELAQCVVLLALVRLLHQDPRWKNKIKIKYERKFRKFAESFIQTPSVEETSKTFKRAKESDQETPKNALKIQTYLPSLPSKGVPVSPK